MAAIQTERPIAVSSPLGEDVLLLHSMSATERLGGLFEINLDLLSEDENLNFADILGQSVTVRLEAQRDQERFFNGYVSRFSQAGSEGDYARYHATLRPWFWFLTRTADCRIFQEKTVPQIIKQIFDEHDFAEFEDKLGGTYREWVYCVQYRETDFNFVSRLMEQEGIYYYFRHEDGKHTLVLSDSYAAHQPIPGYEEVPFFPPTENVVREVDHIFEWSTRQEIQPGKYALTDFNFETPSTDLQVKASDPRTHARADFEVYDFPGEYPVTDEGDVYVRTRLEELQAGFERVQGMGNARGLFAGGLFNLTGFPRGDQEREYLVVSASHDLKGTEYATGGSADRSFYSCSFSAIESKQQFRRARVTPKPIVQGPQTAIVVGPAGEEIYSDDYGRVKVQFHWDREGKEDENSSCWIRVAQLWAGKTWGGIHIPRIGQEVIVEFLEGDPDRPIITGRVYNAEAMPPYTLPANQTQSGIKSRSSKGGTGDNFNEIRFEDKKGEEQVYIHAEKNQDIVVENDETHSVGHDRTKDVKNDESNTIGNNRTESVGKDESIKIGENRTESVGKDESITIGENRTEQVGKDESITIRESRTEHVGKDEAVSIANNRTKEVGKTESVSVGADRSHEIGKNDSLSVGKKLMIDAGDQIILETGSASLIMKRNGDIILDGNNITIKGSGKVSIKAGSDVILKGSKVKQN